MARIGEHAVVLGASPAGLLTARVLTESFDRVTLVDPRHPARGAGAATELAVARDAQVQGHVATVRHHVVDALTDEQVDQLADIADAVLARLDPAGTTAATYTRYDAGTSRRPADG
jgi:2-polyprenyl-6-methoxyphenol hydroxylase-like FAD-dependent oxidoreductase